MTTSIGYAAIGEPLRPTPAQPASAAIVASQDLTPHVSLERDARA
jgi:hypothetical protein